MAQIDVAPDQQPAGDVPGHHATPAGVLAFVGDLGPQVRVGRTHDGALVTARWVSDVGAHNGDGPRLERRVEGLSGWRASCLVPVVGLARRGDAVWLLSEHDGGVTARRLLQVAHLSPDQAVLITGDVLAGLSDLRDAGLVHGDLGLDTVHLGPGGLVRLSEWGPAALETDAASAAAREDDLVAAAGLVDRLRRSVRSPGGAAAERGRLLMAVLEDVEQALASGDLVVARARLDPVAPSDGDPSRVRNELGVLVRAVPGRAAVRHAPVPERPAARPVVPAQPDRRNTRRRGMSEEPPAPAAPVVAEPPPSPMRQPRPSVATMVWGGTWRPLAAMLALVLVVGVEVLMLRDHLSTDIDVLLGRDGSGTGSAADTMPTLPPVPVLAPPAAGPLEVVDTRPLQNCRPGEVCTFRVLVEREPNRRPLTVRWEFAIVDRCTGSRVTVPGGSGRIPAGAGRLEAVSRVRVPEGSALAVVAVTTAPARAAAPAVPVPATGGTCT